MTDTLQSPEDFLPLTPAVFNILLALADSEKHGYGIMLEVEANTNGQVLMGPGTLYGSIKRMLKAGLIEESDERADPEMDDQRRQLYEQLDIQWSIYDQVDQRLSLYENQVLSEAKQNAEAALSAYQAGVIEFGIVVRARLTELNSELQYLKLKVDKAKAQVELLYLSGS